MSSSRIVSPPSSFAARALVCIPTYNERDNIEAITRATLDVDNRVDILVVDDNSPDGTGKLADELAAKEPRLRVLHRPEKRGLGKAYLHAFREALALGYGFVVEMDADFSHDPRCLPKMIDEATRGTHLVLGSRYVPGGGTVNWGIGRRILSRGGSLYARTILGVDVADLTGGFKCFRREVLEALDLDAIDSTGYAFQIEMTYRALRRGFVVEELPIVFEDRRVGQSKMSRAIFLEAIAVVWKLRLGE
ncbi:MAG TPA: polyprenol monophosphomannose synthase [Polyangium sp.]|nr:polyprenol monophosphomannose synthase [Polyangium sp.]